MFRVSKELKAGISGKFKWANGLPLFTDPAVEFKHKFGAAHGSSIIISHKSLAFAHMHRLTRAGNIWVSGLVNCSFGENKLTPKQMSLCTRFHPSGSEFAENTVATACFDTPNIPASGDVLEHGCVTFTAINKLRKDLMGGLQIAQATGSRRIHGNRIALPEFSPLVQTALCWKYRQSRVHLTASMLPMEFKHNHEATLSLEHRFEEMALNSFASVSYMAKAPRFKWSVGIYMQLDDVFPL